MLMILKGFILASILGPVDPNHSGLAPNAFCLVATPFQWQVFRNFCTPSSLEQLKYTQLLIYSVLGTFGVALI
jgi:hypothetical protein